jgi:hypothetical protein
VRQERALGRGEVMKALMLKMYTRDKSYIIECEELNIIGSSNQSFKRAFDNLLRTIKNCQYDYARVKPPDDPKIQKRILELPNLN